MTRKQLYLGVAPIALLLVTCGGIRAERIQADAVPPVPEREDRPRGVEIPLGMSVPTLRLSVVQDSVSGWNLFAEVNEFRFAPESAARELRPGEGHAYVYVDGDQIARVYGPAYHLDPLEPGTHEIKYTLNANDRSAYLYRGEEIADSVTIEVPVPPREAGRRRPYTAPLAIPAGEPRPTVALQVSVDPHSGWNLTADVDGFDFAPERVGGERAPRQGHAQLYVDGQRIARLYGRSYHLSDLGPGTHRIQVSLVGNDHTPYVHRGEAIAATVHIEVPAKSSIGGTDSAIAPATVEHLER